MSLFKSQNAISGSIIQNSDACVLVLEFSALNVGPKVYVFLYASANVSASNCPDTVSAAGLLKKSLSYSNLPVLATLFKSSVVT